MVATMTQRYSEREVADLLEQLHATTRSGLPLPAGLRAAGDELESPALRATFLLLASHLEAGGRLDEALLAEANRFPAHLRGLVLAGARTGRLTEVLGEFVESGNLGQALRHKVWAAVAYPLGVLGIVIGLVIVICHLTTGITEATGWTDLLQDFGIAAPVRVMSSDAVSEVARFVTYNDVWLLLGLVGATGFGYVLWRTAPPPKRRRFLESIPLVGPLIRFAALAEFCHLAALLIEAETPLPEALDLAGASVRDPALAEACARMAASVAEGHTLTEALRLWTSLPPGLGQLLAWGEGQGSLAEALRFAGEMFEARAKSQATFNGQVINASLVFLTLWWIGFAVAAVYLPIASLIRVFALVGNLS